MYNTDIHTQKPCCHTGMQITNVSSHAKHIQSTQKTMLPHGNCRRKSWGKNYKSFVTCNAHENPCNHMVITGENHVDANYKCGFSAVYVQFFSHASTCNSCCVELLCKYAYFMWNFVTHGFPRWNFVVYMWITWDNL